LSAIFHSDVIVKAVCMFLKITKFTEARPLEELAVAQLVNIYRCPRRNVKYFGRLFLMLNYTDITQNTYTQS